MTDMDKMMIEPCPFCGCRASVDKMFPKFAEPWFVSAYHTDECELRCADGSRLCHKTREQAVKSWNTRAYNPDDRLREALEKARDKFREYEQHHNDEAQKIFRDGSGQGLLGAEIQAMNDRRARAERNREMADMIDSALSPLPQGDG